MLAANSSMTAVAHSVDSSTVRVTALGHSSFAYRIVDGASSTEGAATILPSAADSSAGSEELARLREVGSNIASRRLSKEWWFLLAILLHFLDLIFNHDGLIDHVLEIDVIGVEQLKLNDIIQPI
jgi:hypothetical protein